MYQWIHSCFFSHTLPVLLTYHIIIIHSILFSSLPVITTSVKLSQMNVPEIVYHGESTWLNCSYDLQNEPLYSVKWFKKNENEVKEEYIWSEIYRFVSDICHLFHSSVHPSSLSLSLCFTFSPDLLPQREREKVKIKRSEERKKKVTLLLLRPNIDWNTNQNCHHSKQPKNQ